MKPDESAPDRGNSMIKGPEKRGCDMSQERKVVQHEGIIVCLCFVGGVELGRGVGNNSKRLERVCQA